MAPRSIGTCDLARRSLRTSGLTFPFSKLARKKCSEERPRCKRCIARDWPCEYNIRRRDEYSEVSADRGAGNGLHHPPSPAIDPYLSSSTLPNIASILNPAPTLFGGSATSYSGTIAPPPPPWLSSTTSNIELADFAGSLDFIESAFPRINHVSPGSASSTDRPAVYEGLNTSYPGSVIPLHATIGLWDHERIYLKTFEEDFWSVIVRKDSSPSLAHLHFSQLATFEPLKFAILAVGAAFRAQTLDADEHSQRQAILDESIRFHSKAVRGLKVSIGNEPRSLWNAIIACTFCLFFYELIRGDITTTPAQHLLGALHLMKIDKNAGLNRTSTFHQKIFRYYDVIAALSLGRRPLTGSLTYQEKDPTSNIRHSTRPEGVLGSYSTYGGGYSPHAQQTSQLGGHQQQPPSTDPYGCVDNIFGLSATFWPLLHRLAELTRVREPFEEGPQRTSVATAPTSSPYNIVSAGQNLANNILNNGQTSPTQSASPSHQQARNGRNRHPILPPSLTKQQRISLSALELSIHQWSPYPHLTLHAINMEHYASDSALQSLLSCADSYRHAALIHLWRFYTESYYSQRMQSAVRECLHACLRVMVFGGPYGGVLWPLFTAGSCSIAEKERVVVRTVLGQLEEVVGLGCVRQARALLVEVWREMDKAGAVPAAEEDSAEERIVARDVRWQDVAERLGWSIVLA